MRAAIATTYALEHARKPHSDCGSGFLTATCSTYSRYVSSSTPLSRLKNPLPRYQKRRVSGHALCFAETLFYRPRALPRTRRSFFFKTFHLLYDFFFEYIDRLFRVFTRCFRAKYMLAKCYIRFRSPYISLLMMASRPLKLHLDKRR